MTPEKDASSGEPIITVKGEKVALGPIRRDLVPVYTRWMNDLEVSRGTRVLAPMTLDAEEAWYEGASKAGPAIFTIYELSTGRPIGNAGLHEIDHPHRVANFGIVIGEKDCWNRGYGTEATRLVLDYGFNCLGLHNIMLEVFGFNRWAIRAYLAAGFKEIGRRREAHRLGAVAYDIIYMDCLATEFHSPVLRRLLVEDSGGAPTANR